MNKNLILASLSILFDTLILARKVHRPFFKATFASSLQYYNVDLLTCTCK